MQSLRIITLLTFVMLVFVISGYGQTPLNGSYTVGLAGNYPSLSNPGGIFEAINLAGASGPVTINIISDLVGETGIHPLNPIAGSPNVLIKPSGAPRIVTGAGIAIIRLNGADNIRVDGSTGATFAETAAAGNPALRELTIENLRVGSTGAVVSIHSGADGAQNNTFQNINLDGAAPIATLMGVHIGGANLGESGADNDGNSIINCRIRRSQFGIFSSGSDAIPLNPNLGTTIQGNEIGSATANDRIQRGGILVFDEDGILIADNSVTGIDNTDQTADAFGIALGAQNINVATIGGGEVNNAIVTRNRISGVTNDATYSAAGIIVAGGAGGPNTISNNMITGVISDGTANDIPVGIFVAGSLGSITRLYYNSISMTGDRSALLTPGTNMEPSYAIAVSGIDPTVELRNNILYTSQVSEAVANPDALSFGIGMTSTTFANLDSNFNDFFSTGARAGGFRIGGLKRGTGTNLADLTAWNAVTLDDASPDSMEADPLFVNPLSNLHLTGTASPAYNQGTPISVLVDHDNQIRSIVGGVPDIGADEFMATTAASVSVSGRVLTAKGRGIGGAVIELSGGSLSEPRRVRTGRFGSYQFSDLEAGQTYVVSISHRRYSFSPFVIDVQDDISNLEIAADEK